MAEPADQDAGDDLLQRLGRNRALHVGIDVTRGIALTVIPLARAFLCQRLGETVDARLGGGVVDFAVLPGLAIRTAHVYDTANRRVAHTIEG